MIFQLSILHFADMAKELEFPFNDCLDYAFLYAQAKNEHKEMKLHR